MSKISIAKGTLVVVLIITVLVAGGVSAGINLMIAGPPGCSSLVWCLSNVL
jgi:hypothetical protein